MLNLRQWFASTVPKSNYMYRVFFFINEIDHFAEVVDQCASVRPLTLTQ